MRAVARSLPDRRADGASPTLAKKRLIRVETGGRRFEVRRRPGVAAFQPDAWIVTS